MFEKLFVKTSDLVFHQIAPYAVERESFRAHHVKRAHTSQILDLLGLAVFLAVFAISDLTSTAYAESTPSFSSVPWRAA